MVKISLLSPLVTPTFRFATCKIHSSFCTNQCSLMVILSMLVFWKDIMMLRDIGNCCDCSGCIWWEEHQVTGMARQFEVFGMWEYSMPSFKACDLDTFLPPLASPFPHAQIYKSSDQLQATSQIGSQSLIHPTTCIGAFCTCLSPCPQPWLNFQWVLSIFFCRQFWNHFHHLYQSPTSGDEEVWWVGDGLSVVLSWDNQHSWAPSFPLLGGHLLQCWTQLETKCNICQSNIQQCSQGTQSVGSSLFVLFCNLTTLRQRSKCWMPPSMEPTTSKCSHCQPAF